MRIAYSLVVVVACVGLLSVGRTSHAAVSEDRWFANTADPKTHHWELTNFLRGTPDEVKKTLDSEAIGLAAKSGAALGESDLAALRLEERKRTIASILHASKEYQDASAAMDKTKEEMDAVKRSGAATETRMDASSRFNKAKSRVTALDAQLEKDAESKGISLQMNEAKQHAKDLRATAEKALEWRKKLVDAAFWTVTLHGPIDAGDTMGILGEVKVTDTAAGGEAIVVAFELLTPKRTLNVNEGITTTDCDVAAASIALPKSEAPRRRHGDRITLNRVYQVTQARQGPLGPYLVVARRPSDVEYLLETIHDPPDLDAIAETARKRALGTTRSTLSGLTATTTAAPATSPAAEPSKTKASPRSGSPGQ